MRLARTGAAPTGTIANLSWTAEDNTGGVLLDYAAIIVDVEDNADGDFSGGMRLNCVLNNSTTNFIQLNNGENGFVELNRTTSLGANILQFRTANASIQENATNGLEIDVATGENIFLRVNNANEYDFDSARLDLTTNNLFMGDATTIQWGGSATRRIFNDTSGFIIEVDGSDIIVNQIAGTPELTITATTINLQNNILQFATGETISMQTNDMIFDVTASDIFSFDIAGVPEVTISASQMDLTGLSIINATIDGDLNTFVDINETQMNVSVGASTTVLTSNGVGSPPTYQTPTGGEFTGAWTANHNDTGSTFALEDAKFADPTTDSKTLQWNLAGMTAAIELTISTSQSTAQTLTIPNTTGADDFVLEDFIQTLTNKTIDLDANTLTGTAAEFNTALQSETFFFISNNISNMATSTSAQFDTANSDGTFFLNGDNISAMATSTAAQFDTANSDENFAYEGQANTWGTDNQNIAATGEWQEGGVAISPIGVHDIPISATGMYATTTLPATGLTLTELPTNDIDIQTWDFTSTTADERVQFSTPLPRNYNNGAVTVSFTWSQSSGTGNVVWRVGAVAAGQGEAIDQAFTFSADVVDAGGTANQYQQFTTASFTPTGTPADANQMHWEVMRQGSDSLDTFTGTARLHSIVIHMTTDAATAA